MAVTSIAQVLVGEGRTSYGGKIGSIQSFHGEDDAQVYSLRVKRLDGTGPIDLAFDAGEIRVLFSVGETVTVSAEGPDNLAGRTGTIISMDEPWREEHYPIEVALGEPYGVVCFELNEVARIEGA